MCSPLYICLDLRPEFSPVWLAHSLKLWEAEIIRQITKKVVKVRSQSANILSVYNPNKDIIRLLRL